MEALEGSTLLTGYGIRGFFAMPLNDAKSGMFARLRRKRRCPARLK